MSDVDPTPTTPVTIGDRMAWWRGDLAARLTALEATVAANHTATLAALTGLDGRTLTDVFNQCQNTAAQTNYIGGFMTGLDDRLDKIQSVLGAAPYNSTETGNIRALLLELVYAQSRYGIMPDTNPSEVPLQSAGTTTNDGFRWIQWPAISGVTISPDGVTLTPASNWTGYQVYIRTDAPIARIHDVTDPTQSADIPVNSWVTLSGSHQFAFSVESAYSAAGYMRVPAVTTITSVQASYSDPYAGSGSRYHAIIPGYVMTNHIVNTTYTTNVVHTGSALGKTFTLGANETALFSDGSASITLSHTPTAIAITSTSFQIFSNNPFTLSVS